MPNIEDFARANGINFDSLRPILRFARQAAHDAYQGEISRMREAARLEEEARKRQRGHERRERREDRLIALQELQGRERQARHERRIQDAEIRGRQLAATPWSQSGGSLPKRVITPIGAALLQGRDVIPPPTGGMRASLGAGEQMRQQLRQQERFQERERRRRHRAFLAGTDTGQ